MHVLHTCACAYVQRSGYISHDYCSCLIRCESIMKCLTHNTLFLVSCPSLPNPDNGIVTCSQGDNGVPTYEDTCDFTCNSGYELTGSDSRTCQSSGSWSGSVTMCTRGMLVFNSSVYIVGWNDTLAIPKLITEFFIDGSGKLNNYTYLHKLLPYACSTYHFLIKYAQNNIYIYTGITYSH